MRVISRAEIRRHGVGLFIKQLTSSHPYVLLANQTKPEDSALIIRSDHAKKVLDKSTANDIASTIEELKKVLSDKNRKAVNSK